MNCTTFALLGAASALALVLGQYPYLYLTVAFIQMLKAFSPAYMVVLLSCLGIEYPSTRIKLIVMGLCVSAAIASAGEVNFHMLGIIFMVGASLSDALRLVLAQWLLKNRKLEAIEQLYYTSPICLMWLAAALIFELPAIYRHQCTDERRSFPPCSPQLWHAWCASVWPTTRAKRASHSHHVG